ncbi:MAG: helix-turn-helix domain-containing protein [Acidimicrobiia bacterium]
MWIGTSASRPRIRFERSGQLRPSCVHLDAVNTQIPPVLTDDFGMPVRPSDQLLSIQETAEYLAVSVSTVRRWLRRDELEHIRVGRT